MADMAGTDRRGAVDVIFESALEHAEGSPIAVGDLVCDKTDSKLRIGRLVSVDGEIAKVSYDVAEDAPTFEVQFGNLVSGSKVQEFLSGGDD